MEESEKQVSVDRVPLNDGLEVGRQKSKLIGENVEAMKESGLTFCQALETTLKVYDL
jgi:hypothetical protein